MENKIQLNNTDLYMELDKKRKRKKRLEDLKSFAFISPWVIGLIIFTIGPMLMSLFLSFSKWDIISGFQSVEFIGLKNYIKLFTDDPLFYQSLKVTFKFALIFLPASQILAIAIALLLNTKVKGMKIFRTIFFLPSIMPAAAVSLLWVWIFNPQFGVINTILYKLFGIEGPAWLQDPNTALYSLMLMGLWGVGGTMIIYLSGLQGVPRQLYEAASVDGASPLRQLFSITLPMISPTIFFNTVMGVIGAFQYFTQAYVMTNGGPLNSTLFYNLYLYNTAFKDYNMGYASAMAWVLFVIVLIFTMFIFKSSSLWVYYEAEVKK